jgi:hypothetical protein
MLDIDPFIQLILQMLLISLIDGLLNSQTNWGESRGFFMLLLFVADWRNSWLRGERFAICFAHVVSQLRWEVERKSAIYGTIIVAARLLTTAVGLIIFLATSLMKVRYVLLEQVVLFSVEWSRTPFLIETVHNVVFLFSMNVLFGNF